MSEGPLTRTGSAHSSRRALYTAELFSNSLTPAHRCRVKVIHSHDFSPRSLATQFTLLTITLTITLTAVWTCDSPRQPPRVDTAGVETITPSSSPSNRSLTLVCKWICDGGLQAKQNTYNGESHISLPNFGKPSEDGGQQGPRTSVRKSNLKVLLSQLSSGISVWFSGAQWRSSAGWLESHSEEQRHGLGKTLRLCSWPSPSVRRRVQRTAKELLMPKYDNFVSEIKVSPQKKLLSSQFGLVHHESD